MSKRGRWIGGLVAVVAAAVGFVAAALLGVRVSDPAVQGAVVGAIAGVTGGVLGAGITAWTTRQTAADTLRDAWDARFADRIRDLAAQMLDSADRYVTACDRVKAPRWNKDVPEPPQPELGHTFGQVAQELRLLARLPATQAAVGGLSTAVEKVKFEVEVDWIAGPAGSWGRAQQGYRAAVEQFEDAVRVELGRSPIERPAAAVTEGHEPWIR